ncbi:hypothetical protein HNQ56_002128 [Anaerotaenia torta]
MKSHPNSTSAQGGEGSGECYEAGNIPASILTKI